MPELSQPEDVRAIFKEILISADDRLPICGLEQSSFSYNVPENGIAKIDGYLHVNKTSLLADTAVRTWIFDDRIVGEIIWTPILPGRNGDWRQHSLIRSTFAASEGCDGGTNTGTRRLEDWVGKSSDKIGRAGRPKKESADRGPAESGGGDDQPANLP